MRGKKKIYFNCPLTVGPCQCVNDRHDDVFEDSAAFVTSRYEEVMFYTQIFFLWTLHRSKRTQKTFFSTQIGLIFNPHRGQRMDFHTEQRTQALVCLEIKTTPVHVKTCAAARPTSQSEEGKRLPTAPPWAGLVTDTLIYPGLELYTEQISLLGMPCFTEPLQPESLHSQIRRADGHSLAGWSRVPVHAVLLVVLGGTFGLWASI